MNVAYNCTLIPHCGKILMEFGEGTLLRLGNVPAKLCLFHAVHVFWREKLFTSFIMGRSKYYGIHFV